MLVIMPGTRNGLTRPGPLSRSVRTPSVSVARPPIPLPRMTPISSAFSGVTVSSALVIASPVAASAKWMKRS